ncbi:hypothetical protein [Streptomyces sp. CA-106110]|uniref:hypothetical protein n=1 Tax=Streptomyces sp. CA-106110 TaxID=3240044 RepID=UPI003D9288C5
MHQPDLPIQTDDTSPGRRHAADADEVTHTRVHVLGLDPVPPISISHDDDGAAVVHARCACPRIADLAAQFEHISLAAADWLDQNTRPWRLCPTSQTRVTAPTAHGRITATHRSSDGTALIEIEQPDGQRTTVPLHQVTTQP